MTEASKKWRCPYCDGLNDWQNEVCEVCGDGRRDETLASEKTAKKTSETSQTYVTQQRKNTEEDRKRDENKETARTAASPPPPPPAPKKKGKTGLLIAVIVVALGALGGRFMADRYVESVRANQPMSTTPAVIETPEIGQIQEEASAPVTEAAQGSLVEATHAPLEEATHASLEENQPSLWSALRAQQSASPLASISSVTDNGNGLVTLHMQFVGEPGPYTIYCCYLGSDPDAPSPLNYQLEEKSSSFVPAMSFQSIELVSRDYESPATVPVIPGGYTAFLVSCYTEGNPPLLTWSVSEPYYFEEVQGSLPLMINDVRLCSFDKDGDRYAYLKSLEGSDDSNVPQPEEFELNSAAELNESAAMSVDSWGRSGKYLAYDVTMQLNTTPYDFKRSFTDASFGGLSSRLLALLTGPGFCVADQAHAMSLDQGYCRMGTWNSVFDNNFRVVNEMGGYPPGNYTLDFFVCGRKLYTMRFTLY